MGTPENIGSRLRSQLDSFATERPDEGSADLDLMSVADQVSVFTRANESVAGVVAAQAPAIAAAIDLVVGRLERGGRLVYVGAGTAGRVGIVDASEIPPTFGTDPALVVGLIAGGDAAFTNAIENVEDDEDAGARDIAALELGSDDVVVGISASGRTPYVLAAIAEARRRGAGTVGFACNAGSALGEAADIAIETVVGPEVIAGSTRLKAGTAQKLVLNMVSSIAMVRLGKVYRNLMVDMRATNDKLRARAVRTVMLATDADAERAADALAQVDGWIKAAILVITAGCTGPEAVKALEAAGGRLRDAITAVG